MRQATPRAWSVLAFGAAAAVGSLGVADRAVAQQEPAPTDAVVDPIEPAGRAVCNTAFTLTSAIGLTSFVVPPDAPLGPNEVIVALRPVLDACVGVFPPEPQRQCLTSGLYPNTGLPITLPDPVGILSEQVEAVSDAVLPLGLALSGPLDDVFRSALECRDDVEAPVGDDAAVPPVVEAPPSTEPPASSTTEPTVEAVTTPVDEQAAPSFVGTPVEAPDTSFLSSLPAPLRGAAAVASGGFVALGAFVFRRVLSPRRPLSILDADPAIRR